MYKYFEFGEHLKAITRLSPQQEMQVSYATLKSDGCSQGPVVPASVRGALIVRERVLLSRSNAVEAGALVRCSAGDKTSTRIQNSCANQSSETRRLGDILRIGVRQKFACLSRSSTRK